MDANKLASKVRLSVRGSSMVLTLKQALLSCDRMGSRELSTAVIWFMPPIQLDDGGRYVTAITETEILPLIAKTRAK